MSNEPIIETVVKPQYQTLVKALWVVAAGLVSVAIAIFSAGLYWANFSMELGEYKKKVDKNILDIEALQKENSKLKSDLNLQFSRLLDIQNAEAFKNTASANGSGFSPEHPPGRCAAGEVIVGLQPMQGGFDITFQCGKLPLLKID